MKKLKALFKAEILASFRMLYGFVFLACYWGALAYLAISHNLSFASVDISAVLSSMTIVVALLIPIIIPVSAVSFTIYGLVLLIQDFVYRLKNK
jgi:hypothetical protein